MKNATMKSTDFDPTAFIGCGAAYDPVFWSKEIRREHVAQMRECGLGFVRLFEFCWSSFEPRQGVYDFDWADEFLDLLDENGLRYVLCTPGAAPPRWLTHDHPETVVVHADGRRDRCELRRHGCPTNGVFMERCLAVSERMARRYGKRSGLLGWQIDNEIGHPVCYCAGCEKRFRKWLEQRFDSLQEANRRLGLKVWSGEWASWDHVAIPREGSPQLRHAFRQWTSSVWIDYVDEHLTVLRPHSSAPITTNMTAPWHGFDHYEMAERLDVVGMDYYPYVSNPKSPYGYNNADMDFNLSFTRGIAGGKPFWLMETSALNRRRSTPMPGDVGNWVIRQIAHGANLICFFRWDTAPFGKEEFTRGIVGPGTWKSPAYDEIAAVCAEVKRLAPSLQGSRLKPAETAVLFSFPSWWKFLDSSPCPTLTVDPVHGYPLLIKRHAFALTALNVRYDMVGPEADWSGRGCLIAPALVVIDETLGERLRDFVEKGGTLILTALSGLCDGEGKAHDAPYPGAGLVELFGIESSGGGPLVVNAEPPAIHLEDGDSTPDAWLEEIGVTADDVETWLSYDHGFYKRFPAVTARRVGAGLAIYVNAFFSESDTVRLYRELLSRLDARLEPHPSAWSRFRLSQIDEEIDVTSASPAV